VYKLNIEAADEIMRQLRLRHIGGIILVDFIDMETQQHNDALLERMRQLAL
jgi:ribonuclease G